MGDFVEARGARAMLGWSAMQAAVGTRLATFVSLGSAAALLVACGGSSPARSDGGLRDGGEEVDRDATTSLCYPSPFRCEGTRAIPCDAAPAQSAEDCALTNQVCSASLGCSDCRPGDGTCQDGAATWCRDDGTLAHFECDTMQGLTCTPNGCVGPCSLNEVHDSYIGCDYYPTVTLNPVWSGFSFAVAVSNTTGSATKVVITRGDAVVAEGSVPANALQTFELPWVGELKGGDIACTLPPLPGATRLVKDGAYRLRSDRPVTVYQFSPLEYRLNPMPAACPVIDSRIGQCPASHDNLPASAACLSYSNDASLLLPATALTGSYTALAWPTQNDGGRISGSGFVAITATQDGTQVDVRSTGNIVAGGGLEANGTGIVTLDRGDVLELVAAADSDVSGTRVRADKPVQVIAGQSCAFVPDSSVTNCDHIEEGLFPEDTLGASYVVTMPVMPTTADERAPAPFVMRISAILDGTEVTFDPPVHAPISVDAGKLIDVSLAAGNADNVLVKGTKPFQIATYMVGQSALPSPNGVIGDPSMSLAIPVEQFRESYLFTAPTTYDINYASVVAKMGTTVHIDGTRIEASEFKVVGGSEYGVAQVLLSSDASVHSLNASDEVGLTVYGYGWYTSYMYPGGADLDRITTPPIL